MTGRSAFAIAGLGCALVLAGCAGRGEGGLSPTPLRAAGSSRVEMLVATTRAPTGTPDMPFAGDRGDATALQRIVVSIPPEMARHVGDVQWPSSRPVDPATSFAVLESRPVDAGSATSWFRRTGKHHVLIFVHGFDTRHDEAVFRFAQLVHDSGTAFAPVLFSWPSRGSVWAYDYDKESTNGSRDALETLLRRVAAEPGVSDVTVLAHSMGSWLAVEALRQMAIRDGRVPAKIRDVILASPDLDVDVFGHQIERIGRGPHFTLLVSRDDHALDLSKFNAGGVERLGGIDPTAEPHRTMLEKRGVTVYDLSALKTSGPLNHGKFTESPDAVRVLGERLLAGQPVSDPHVGFGDRVGALVIGSVGSATSLVVHPSRLLTDPPRR